MHLETRGEGFVLPADLAKETLLCFYQAYFSQNAEFNWNADERRSRIFIVDKFAYNREVAEQRPALVTDRGDMRFSGRHVDQHLKNDGLTGRRVYADVVTVPVTVNAISREGLEAERLGQMAWLLPVIFKDELRKQGRVLNVVSSVCGRESILKKDSRPDLHLVSVLVVLEINYSWSLEDKHAKTLAGFDFRIRDPKKLSEMAER